MAHFERVQIGHPSLAADIAQAGVNLVAARRDLPWEAPEPEAGLLNREHGHCGVNLEVGDGAATRPPLSGTNAADGIAHTLVGET